MIWSKYNFLFKNENNYFIYNCLSSYFAEMDYETYQKLEKIKESGIYKNLQDEELLSSLKLNGVLTKSDKDDLNNLKLSKLLNQFDNRHLILTILPTLDCNFNCTYCYEESRPPKYMSKKTEDNIYDFIKSYSKIDYVYIVWYGGEPLLNFSSIKSISEKLLNDKKEFSASMVTNGYLLNADIAEQLEYLKISSIQITLDGLAKTHDKRRRTIDGNSESFSTIINNLEYLFEINKQIKVTIRVNIDKSNEDEFFELESYIYNKFNNSQINIYPAFVMDKDDCLNVSDCLMDRKAQAEFYLKNKRNDTKKILNYFPNINPGDCIARFMNGYIIGPDSEVYKCWYDIGKEEKMIMNLSDISNVNNSLLTQYLVGSDAFSDNKCNKCNYLPICGGGCAYDRLENELNSKSIDLCSIFKNNIEDFLKAHHEVKTNCI